MKLFDIFGKLKRKKEPKKMLEANRNDLPNDLERFRIKREPIPAPEPLVSSPYQAPQQLSPRPGLPPVGPPKTEIPKGQVLEKEDMILQKLETIDARLRLIEEKMK